MSGISKKTNKTMKEQTDGNNNSEAVAAAGKNLDAYEMLTNLSNDLKK